MKNKPFSEIMDFDEERDEYIKLCKCKSENYTYYSEWEQHITDCIQNISDPEKVENFRRYCISRERTTSKSPELFGTYAGLLIGACTGILLNKIPDSLAYVILLILVATFLIFYVLKQHKDVIYESSFFEDIIEIIEKMQNKGERSE